VLVYCYKCWFIVISVDFGRLRREVKKKY